MRFIQIFNKLGTYAAAIFDSPPLKIKFEPREVSRARRSLWKFYEPSSSCSETNYTELSRQFNSSSLKFAFKNVFAPSLTPNHVTFNRISNQCLQPKIEIRKMMLLIFLFHPVARARISLGFSETRGIPPRASILSSLTLISTFVWVTLCYKVAPNCCEDSLIIFSSKTHDPPATCNNTRSPPEFASPREFTHPERLPLLAG